MEINSDSAKLYEELKLEGRSLEVRSDLHIAELIWL